MSKQIIKRMTAWLLVTVFLVTLYPANTVFANDSVFSTQPRVFAGNGVTFAIKDNGTVWAWGRNDVGQLGLGFTSDFIDEPQQILGLSNIVYVAVGNREFVALRNDGIMFTWNGSRNPIPVQVTGISDVVAISFLAWQDQLFILQSNGVLSYTRWLRYLDSDFQRVQVPNNVMAFRVQRPHAPEGGRSFSYLQIVDRAGYLYEILNFTDELVLVAHLNNYTAILDHFTARYRSSHVNAVGAVDFRSQSWRFISEDLRNNPPASNTAIQRLREGRGRPVDALIITEGHDSVSALRRSIVPNGLVYLGNQLDRRFADIRNVIDVASSSDHNAWLGSHYAVAITANGYVYEAFLRVVDTQTIQGISMDITDDVAVRIPNFNLVTLEAPRQRTAPPRLTEEELIFLNAQRIYDSRNRAHGTLSDCRTRYVGGVHAFVSQASNNIANDVTRIHHLHRNAQYAEIRFGVTQGVINYGIHRLRGGGSVDYIMELVKDGVKYMVDRWLDDEAPMSLERFVLEQVHAANHDVYASFNTLSFTASMLADVGNDANLGRSARFAELDNEDGQALWIATEFIVAYQDYRMTVATLRMADRFFRQASSTPPSENIQRILDDILSDLVDEFTPSFDFGFSPAIEEMMGHLNGLALDVLDEMFKPHGGYVGNPNLQNWVNDVRTIERETRRLLGLDR